MLPNREALNTMGNITRATVFLIGGLCWFAAALLLAVVAWVSVSDSAGSQFFPVSLSSGSVLLGLVHLVGLFVVAFFCFAIGAALCAHGFVPPPTTGVRRRLQPLVFIRQLRAQRPAPREPGLCCVRCEARFTSSVHICPKCGWTQP